MEHYSGLHVSVPLLVAPHQAQQKINTISNNNVAKLNPAGCQADRISGVKYDSVQLFALNILASIAAVL